MDDKKANLRAEYDKAEQREKRRQKPAYREPLPVLPVRQGMTPYRSLCEDWKGCTRCELHKGRYKVVMYRGKIPCQVLFVGEAPGEAEDVLGHPFVGDAGKLLQAIIDRTCQAVPFSFGLTNLVACVPRDPEKPTSKAHEPPDEAIETCAPRLQGIVRIAAPKLIVCVGKHASDWLDPRWKHSIKFDSPVPQAHLMHPAAILRLNHVQKGFVLQRCVVTLTNAVEDVIAV